MTCPVCGEPAPLGVVCCDLLINELDDEPTEIRGYD
jgi:hypothetical protein